jgi:hypothetical protein
MHVSRIQSRVSSLKAKGMALVIGLGVLGISPVRAYADDGMVAWSSNGYCADFAQPDGQSGGRIVDDRICVQKIGYRLTWIRGSCAMVTPCSWTLIRFVDDESCSRNGTGSRIGNQTNCSN